MVRFWKLRMKVCEVSAVQRKADMGLKIAQQRIHSRIMATEPCNWLFSPDVIAFNPPFLIQSVILECELFCSRLNCVHLGRCRSDTAP